MYIAQHYAKEGQRAEAVKEFEGAISFYKKLERENRGTVLGYSSSGLLTQAYMDMNRLEEAGRSVENTILNYPGTVTYIQQLPLVELIYEKKLDRPKKAIEIYKRVLEATGDYKLKEYIHSKISGMIDAE